MITKILDNGTIAFTGKNQPIEALYKMLATHPLRKDYNHIATERDYKLFNLPKGLYTRYMGNFEDYSFGFDILTTKGDAVDKKLASLFRSNRRKHAIV
jgi:hypothetical protein